MIDSSHDGSGNTDRGVLLNFPEGCLHQGRDLRWKTWDPETKGLLSRQFP
jgi:hypothetical protein